MLGRGTEIIKPYIFFYQSEYQYIFKLHENNIINSIMKKHQSNCCVYHYVHTNQYVIKKKKDNKNV